MPQHLAVIIEYGLPIMGFQAVLFNPTWSVPPHDI